jgi:hypothetical protein
MEWLAAMFPKAQFIHVIRHGRDVASSMVEAIKRWFPLEQYPPDYWETHWNYLMFEDYASRIPELREQLDYVKTQSDNYSRALFVWYCSLWTGRRSGDKLGDQRYLEIHYEDLVKNPVPQLSNVFKYLKEPMNDKTSRFAHTALHSNSVHKADPNPEITTIIAGQMLADLGYSS